jgi:energy-coupling factor transporter transmembrane protein EcfT
MSYVASFSLREVMDNRQNNNDTSRAEYIEQYKSYLQDVGNIGARHENSRRFYLSVVSALFVFLSMAGKDGPLKFVEGPLRILVGMVGIILCVAWVMHMQSFGAIYRAKFDVLREMETQCNLFHLIDEEWKYLQKNPRYKLLTLIDTAIPALFAALFIALLCFMIAYHS